jgi:ArsR family transcriptional regulator, arsenate/arsenite/antimonite-responsive transcriptional repressor
MSDATPSTVTDQKLACRLKAIADPVRLAILRQLPPNADDCDELFNVSELAEAIGVAQSTISHHLRHLRQAELVQCRKMCRDVYYWVNHEAVAELLEEFSALLQR